MNNDLISRSALHSMVCLDPKYGTYGEFMDGSNVYFTSKEVHSMIDEAPAMDAVALPCKVGDTVWGIRNYKGINHPQQGKVDQMYYTNDMRLHIKIKHICIGEWGKKIFPTREEAEAALRRRADHERN